MADSDKKLDDPEPGDERRGSQRPPRDRDGDDAGAGRGDRRPSGAYRDRPRRTSRGRDERRRDERSRDGRGRDAFTPRSGREDRPRSVGDKPRRSDREKFPSRDDRGGERRSYGNRRDDRRDGRGGYRGDREERRQQDRRAGGRPGLDRDDRRGRDDAFHDDRPRRPWVPEGITGLELDKSVREELRSLSKDLADRVGQHLAAALMFADDDLPRALEHSAHASRIGGRIGAVRETHGLLSYRAGDYATAARELRTGMRITGRVDVLPVIADAERGQGRPEKALDVASSDEAERLDVEGSIELMIVVAGAYADIGDTRTALSTLEMPALRQKINGRWQVRLWVAYADMLERADRTDEARRWLTLAADADTDRITDAADRLGRPAPAPAPVPSWESDEQIAVLDVYDDSADDDAPADADQPSPDHLEEAR